MKAEELKKKYLKDEMADNVGVIAIIKKGKSEGTWWHVHDNEDIPKGCTIALHPRGLK